MKRRSALRIATVALAVLAGSCRVVSEKTGIGRPWKEIALPFDADVHELFFLDQNTGWAVGGGRAANGGLVASTRDGGTTWSVQTNVMKRSNPDRFSFLAVRFVDADRGWVGGQGGLILRTLDGGKNWDTQHRGEVFDAVDDLFFLDQNLGWAATRTGILWTADGGEQWTAARGPYYLNGYAIQFLDENTGFVAGKAGILKSTDGGRSWGTVGAPDLDYWGLHFLTPLLGWVVGEAGTIVHTRDGGASWETQGTGLTALPFLMDVKFADERRGFAVGFVPALGGRHDSMILHTENGGKTWSLQQEVEGQQLRSLDLLDAEHAWAAGERTVKDRVLLMRLRP